MSLLVIGVSHRSAPLSLLERVALDGAGVDEVVSALRASANVAETVVVATCNRVELYADVVTFHAGVADLSAALSATTGVPLEGLRDHLYVHYADRAVAHLFTVACGLDSMAVGESQVLGQLRATAARDRLVGMLADDQAEVRLQVMLALDRIDPEGLRQLPALERLARERDHWKVAAMARNLLRDAKARMPEGAVATAAGASQSASP